MCAIGMDNAWVHRGSQVSKLSLLSPLLFRVDGKLARRELHSRDLIKKTRDYEKTIVLRSGSGLDGEIEKSWQPSSCIL